jgi:hypothetical protein
MRIQMTVCIPALLSMVLGGCTTLLRNDAENVRATIGDLNTDQTLDNLGRFLDDPQGVPSLSDLGEGSIEADTAFNPSVTIPFGNQVVTTVAGTAGETITAPSRAFTLGGSAGNKLTLKIVPVTDPYRLRNTAALYRYVLSPSRSGLYSKEAAENMLKADYQLQTQVDDKGAVTVPKGLLLYPQCVLCLNPNAAISEPQAISVNRVGMLVEINKGLAWGWLHSESDPDKHSLGVHNKHALSMPEQDYRQGHLRNLVFLVMNVTPPTSSSKSGS